jgi:hypothetical protein
MRLLQIGEKALAVILLFCSMVSVYAAEFTKTIPIKASLQELHVCWATAQNIERAEMQTVHRKIENSNDIEEAITHVVDGMIGCGANACEVEGLMAENGYTIPDSAKLDWGLNGWFGGSSFMGSFDANLKAASKQGLIKWCSNNAGTIFDYWNSFNNLAHGGGLDQTSQIASSKHLTTAYCGTARR